MHHNPPIADGQNKKSEQAPTESNEPDEVIVEIEDTLKELREVVNLDDMMFEDDRRRHDFMCCKYTRPLRSTLNVLPLSVAISEGADTGMSLYQTYVAVNKTPNIGLVITMGGLSFLASFGLNGETAVSSFEEICDILKHKALPQDWEASRHRSALIREWPKLSSKKEKIVFSLTFSPILLATIADGITSYFFIDAIPEEYDFAAKISLEGWKIFSGAVSGLSSLTALLTKGAETYKRARQLISDEHYPYANCTSRIISPIIGGGLGALATLQDAVKSYAAIKSVFSINAAPGICLLGLGCAMTAPAHFCFSGRVLVDTLDTFLDTLAKKNISAKKIAALTLSFALASCFAYYTRALNEKFYGEVAKDFKFTHYEDAVYLISWIMVCQQTLLNTACLWEPINRLNTKLSRKLSIFKNKFSKSISQPAQLEKSSHSMDSYYSKNNPHLTFNHFSKVQEKKMKKHVPARCGII